MFTGIEPFTATDAEVDLLARLLWGPVAARPVGGDEDEGEPEFDPFTE